MAGIDIKKTELVWPGKYNEEGTRKGTLHVSLPFQVIETVNESRATREAKKDNVQASLFNVYKGNEGDTFEDGWKNKLIWGDNLLVMGSLLEKFAGKIDLIYIDPPFATGADFSFTAPIGDSGDQIFKEQSIVEEIAYRDTWGKGSDSFIAMIYERLILMRNLLADDGSIYVHCDWRMNSLLRLVLDEVFGRDRLVNELIWHYKTFQGQTHSNFAKKHDNLYLYSKSDRYHYREQFDTEFEDTIDSRRWASYINERRQITGSKMPVHDSRFVRYLKKWKQKHGHDPGEDDIVFEVKGQPIDSVWHMKGLDPKSDEKVGYPTQKPEALLERIIKASSDETDLIADFFCGSGTALAVAEKHGRRWIGCDLGRWGIHVTRKRLLSIDKCRPFELLNLGKYERQYWQGVTFGKKVDKLMVEQAFYDYLAFILKLYGAQPVVGMEHLHGKKAKAVVYIGAVDAPVTIDEIDTAVNDCAKLKQKELHVLGWEWEMGLQNLVVQEAKNKGIKLLLLQIPREVMEQKVADKGDVRFFELAYLEATIKKPKKLTAQVTLRDFVIPNAALIPDDVRSKVRQWSDYIDYWAVDWDFRNDTFMQGWVAYRTRKERTLHLTSDPHAYARPGKYQALVKVIDVFGNDTSQAFDVEVK